MYARSKSNRLSRIGTLCLPALIALMLISNASARPQPTFRQDDLTVDNLTIHYRIAGSGPGLLFLHGFTLTGESWELIDDDLESLESATLAFYSELHPGGRSQIKTIFDQLNGMARDTSWSGYLSDRIGSIRCPAYLIAGDRDRYFPPKIESDPHNALSHSRLGQLPGLDHAPLWEELGGSTEIQTAFPDSVRAFWNN